MLVLLGDRVRVRATFVARVGELLRFNIIQMLLTRRWHIRRRIINHCARNRELMLIKRADVSGLPRSTKVHNIRGAYVGVTVRILLVVRRRDHHRAPWCAERAIVGRHVVLRLRTHAAHATHARIRSQRHLQLVEEGVLLVRVIRGVLPGAHLAGDVRTLRARVFRLLVCVAVLSALVLLVVVRVGTILLRVAATAHLVHD